MKFVNFLIQVVQKQHTQREKKKKTTKNTSARNFTKVNST